MTECVSVCLCLCMGGGGVAEKGALSFCDLYQKFVFINQISNQTQNRRKGKVVSLLTQ